MAQPYLVLEGADGQPPSHESFDWDGVACPSRTEGWKRALDVVLALGLGAVLLPVLLVGMAAVRVTSTGPVIYRQPRIGRRCRPFTMYKLRTMCVDAERREREQGGPCSGLFHKPRCAGTLIPAGRLLRKFSIDEIPQLWNVLTGDMSLVGPRPLLLDEFGRFPCTDALRRFAVRPGLTGSWQVSGRSLLHERERLLLDLHYVDNRTLMLDLRILARTPRAVLSGRGAW